MELKATIVFQKTWNVMHLKCYLVRKTDKDGFFDFLKELPDGTLKHYYTKKVDLSKYRYDENKTNAIDYDFLVDVNSLNEFDEQIRVNRYRYIIHEGSSRSSKTISLIDIYDLYSRSYGNKRLTVWRDTKIDCKKTVLTDALKHHKKTSRYKQGYNFNKTDSIFYYNNDSTVEIHGADDEETVHGLTQDVAWINEPYKVKSDTFHQIDQRTSDFVIVDWNPKKDHFIDDLKKDPRAITIKSTFKDNPFCPPNQRKKILGYQPVSMCEIVLNGLISQVDAFKYDFSTNELKFSEKQLNELRRCILNEDKNSASKFKWQVYGLGLKAERENRIFNFKPISYIEYMAINAQVFYGVDWGVVDPMGIIEVKYYDGALYVHELNYDSENEIREKLTLTDLDNIRRHTEEGLIKWLFDKLGISKDKYIVCDNNRPLKIGALRKSGYEYAIATKKWSGSIIDGINVINNLQVYYTNTSKNMEYEQENYSRKVDRYGKVLEEPEDAYNHLCDPLRYVALFLQRMNVVKTI